MKRPIVIDLPYPPRALHAHNTGHWRQKAAPTKAYRAIAKLLTRKAMGRTRRKWDRARLSILIRFPDRRRRDILNVCHSLKPAIDGLVDAGLLLDDNWQVLSIGTIHGIVSKGCPGITLTIERD